MKLLLVCISCLVFAGCGPKSNDEKAKELIKERLKATLPDFSSYESVDFSSISTAFLSFEETSIYQANSKSIKALKDSVIILEELNKKKDPSLTTDPAATIQILKDSIQSKQNVMSEAKQAFVPEKLGKISHAYKAKDAAGKMISKRVIYYFDENFTRIIKEIEAISEPIKI